MIATRDEAREALRGALDVRRRAGVSKVDPVCVYDLAQRLDLEVRFAGGGSFGGMYERRSQTVVVPSLRPPGRRAYSCAHEMGHWYFRHGTRVDRTEDLEQLHERAPDERLANLFAGYLLMAQWAVEAQFEARGWKPSSATPMQIYVVAGVLGVGYTTLVQHLCWSLQILDRTRVEELLRTTPKQLRFALLGDNAVPHILTADRDWPMHLPIDLQVGEGAIVPQDAAIDGNSAVIKEAVDTGSLLLATAPGVSRIESARERWSVFLRVSRRDFAGRSIYRHLEDCDVNAIS